MRRFSTVFIVLVFLTTASSFHLIKTSLGITVRDEVGNTVAEATIQLFEKEEDYNLEQNVVAEGVTDSKGYFRFKEVKAISYYVIVRKDDKDNSGGGERTGKLDENRINKVTVIIQ